MTSYDPICCCGFEESKHPLFSGTCAKFHPYDESHHRVPEISSSAALAGVTTKPEALTFEQWLQKKHPLLDITTTANVDAQQWGVLLKEAFSAGSASMQAKALAAIEVLNEKLEAKAPEKA